MTTTHLMFEGGVPAVVEQAKAIQLTPDELQDTIERMTGLGGMTSDPAPLIEWISEVQPGQAPSALLDWAELDQEGATTWMVAQAPSPVRDQMIARFAREVSNLDPNAAAEWAREITDETLREKTLARIAGK